MMRLVVLLTVLLGVATGQQRVTVASYDKEVSDFMAREVAAHVADISKLDPPQDRVVGALTTGEYSWGTGMRAIAAYTELSGSSTIANKDVAPMIGKMGLIEARNGGKAFSQLYAALALRHFGKELKSNTLWQSLTAQERDAWRSLLDPGRFFDRKNRKVINLPENYLGVASRVAAIGFEMRVIEDRTYVDEVLDAAASHFVKGDLFSDDSPPTGRYDRYSLEYVRYVYDAAETVGRKDIMAALEPSLKTQFRLWWDLMAKDGYSYSWGRSLGAIGYMDTMEDVAFLTAHPNLRPAALPELLAASYQAWRWLRRDFQDERHVLSIYAYGRGNYAYISKDREWQQTIGAMGKMIGAMLTMRNARTAEQTTDFPVEIPLADVNRYQVFRASAGRHCGVWVVRRGSFQFALPFTTGPKAAISDYLAAPYGLPGFAAPVEQSYPALVPYVQLENGTIIAATDCADEVHPGTDGGSLSATWKRWSVVGGKAGDVKDYGLRSDVVWTLTGNTLRREEKLTTAKGTKITRWWMAVPTRMDSVRVTGTSTKQIYVFEGKSGRLSVGLPRPNFILDAKLVSAAGDQPFGRGQQGPLPMHLSLEAKDLTITPAKPLSIAIELTSEPATIAPPTKSPR